MDVLKVAEGHSASDPTGKDAVNESNEKIGSIDDFLISSDGHEVYTVIEVSGFLGVGGKKVAVSFDSLKPGNDEGQMVLPGALKKALENRPEFKDAG